MSKTLSSTHKQAIAQAHHGSHMSASTRAKISKSMAGKSNFEGKSHSTAEKDKIRHSRGHDDRVRGARWIVNRSDKTYRRHSAPNGYKIGQRKFEEGHRPFDEEFLSFKQFLDRS